MLSHLLILERQLYRRALAFRGSTTHARTSLDDMRKPCSQGKVDMLSERGLMEALQKASEAADSLAPSPPP